MKDEIKIPFGVKSRNHIDKLHWSQKSELRSTYQLLIRNQMMLNKLDSAWAGESFDLEIIAYVKRKYDYDNLVGGCKQLIDALCNEGFVWDDDPKHIGKMTITQEKINGKNAQAYTIIRRIGK